MNIAPHTELVLFDGECAVCDASVQWLMDHDTQGRLHYAPLQGPTAASVLARHPQLPAGLDSIVFVKRTEDQETLSWYSDALLDIAGELPSPWRFLRVLRIVPRPVRDLAYRSFAASRYRLFGRLEQCRLPSEDEAARVLP